ncbi:zf-HC2 domain-containing protein [Chelativorans sp. M5D2P16]|uniref:zf-HC2 domain-containing protein n=1 Tax=Chelativorans sp. M5D2P16 TaxID=3095678 RepID=UPI002ACA7BCA|nr:zf-HC2 domain-containing protein [Chelativorans sp. M5D2P16]MDZ5699512.1 zf-HC2 domain-containing protein [Chelativorans sp. M5D2P16]
MTQDLRCEEVIDKLLEYLDRELDAETDEALARHMETCRACFTRAEFERKLRARVNETGKVKAPESLRRRVRAIVEHY